MLDILKEENRIKLEELKNNVDEDEYNEEVEYVEEEIIYYQEYTYDPYYVSPCWLWYW
jgi:hypothetical protein